MGPWLGGAAVEDPFDCSDNCARTIGLDRLPYIAKSFQAAAEAMLEAKDAQGAPLPPASHCIPGINIPNASLPGLFVLERLQRVQVLLNKCLM